MTQSPDTSPTTAPETTVSGAVPVPPRDVLLRALRTHDSYELADSTDGGPDRCSCGAPLEWSRYLTVAEQHQEHQADAILTALLREVLA